MPEVVEKWIPVSAKGFRGKLVRKDLFDCIDILCPQGMILLGIQSTDGTSHSKRVEKAKESKKLRAFMMTTCLFEIWSWSKRSKRDEEGKLAKTKKGERFKEKEWKLRVTQLRVNKNGEITEA